MIKQQPTVLLVDDQRAELASLSALLLEAGCLVVSESEAEIAYNYLEGGRPIDLVLSKMHLDDNGAGYRLLRAWKQACPAIPVVAITPGDDVEAAIEAMRLGASDCVVQPISHKALRRALDRCLAPPSRRPAYEQALATPAESVGSERVLGNSATMRALIEQVRQSAPTSSAVLLTGETGVGKEVLAAAVHRLSRRAKGPFVAVNVAAVPSNQIESELFGHAKGAFPDAPDDRVGRFEAAAGGTLLIDEIGDLEPSVQAKLLHVLESRVVNRVGSNQDIRVDARVVAATSRDLSQLVRDGTFRADLYYRLNVIHLHVPALRHRREDIPLLEHHFLHLLDVETGRGPYTVTPELEQYLVKYDWPGNVRQLKSALESMAVMSHGDVLTMADLPHALRVKASCDPVHKLQLAGISVAEVEKMAITQTLEMCDGNRSQTARKLGISVRTLQRKLHCWSNQQRMQNSAALPEGWRSRVLLPG